MPYVIWLLILLFGGGTAALAIRNHNEPSNDHLPTIVERRIEPGVVGPVQPIPEPGSALLFAVGGVVVGAMVRRRYD